MCDMVALQDLCLRQNPLFIGLLSHLANALQENTETLVEKMQTCGQTMLVKDHNREKQKWVSTQERTQRAPHN